LAIAEGVEGASAIANSRPRSMLVAAISLLLLYLLLMLIHLKSGRSCECLSTPSPMVAKMLIFLNAKQYLLKHPFFN